MNHDLAISVFEEIRNRPYAWSVQKDVPANNCYFKGIELLQRLGAFGYAVRGRVGETYLDKKIPDDIRKLYPNEFLLTHFYVEIQLDGQWKILDPSYDPPLAKHGFIVNDWGSHRTCFDITRLYSHEDQVAYQQEWFDPIYAEQYFRAIGSCAVAINEYLEGLRVS